MASHIFAVDLLKIVSPANRIRIFYFLQDGKYLTTKVFPCSALVKMTFGLYSAFCFSVQAWHDELQLYCRVSFSTLGEVK